MMRLLLIFILLTIYYYSNALPFYQLCNGQIRSWNEINEFVNVLTSIHTPKLKVRNSIAKFCGNQTVILKQIEISNSLTCVSRYALFINPSYEPPATVHVHECKNGNYPVSINIPLIETRSKRPIIVRKIVSCDCLS
uniref:Ston n=1 Tax=Schmidtea mediterranea TaxID=79327 RepID=I1ZI64_SCHMD|nr:ston [Schmidtea mediterranea]